MLIPFCKMQAQGNDFVILQLLHTHEIKLPWQDLAKEICDRRKGVGADGLVLLLGDPNADARMLIYNSDGSRAAMCGSALRCCARLLSGLRGDSKLRIATDSGVLDAVIEAEEISVKLGMPQMLENNLVLEGIEGALIGVGNWHFVSYQKELKDQEFEFGPLLEQHSHFPDGVNVEFARVVSRNQIDMTIWERGAGATQACGTGAVATVFCGIQKGFLDSEVRVNMPGGTVSIRALENGEFILAGAVEHTFNGVYTWKI